MLRPRIADGDASSEGLKLSPKYVVSRRCPPQSKQANTMRSISVRNNTNASFYRRHGRRASFLIHPYGLRIVEFYSKEKQKPPSVDDAALANALATEIAKVLGERETEISKALRTVLETSWKDEYSITGEREESIEGTLRHSDQRPAGNPDVVVRTTPQTPISGEIGQRRRVILIIDVSVDNNGGEKKIGRAFEYANLIDAPHETVLLFSLHVDRTREKHKLTQEAFIYMHSDLKEKRKIGFLWREVYERNEGECVLHFLERGFVGIVRCLKCAEHLRAISSSSETLSSKKWDVVSDNVAIQDESKVFKVFDSRSHPTIRRPDHWLEKHPWTRDLQVKKHLEFKESGDVDQLGRPTRKRYRGEDYDLTVSYPKGTVLVLRYGFVKGSHIATKASDFKAIAECIKSMHAVNIVHSDIRGFNMLHPVSGGIQVSRLIDFDLCGQPGVDSYHPGFSEMVCDNCFPRSGKPEKKVQKRDDWQELASVMAHYTIFDDAKKREAWDTLVLTLRDSPSGEDVPESIESYIRQYGDCKIEVPLPTRRAWDLMLKGTGSPNKNQQRSRGSLTTSQGSS